MRAAYRCEGCGAAFSRPALLHRSQRMPDGFRERQTFWVCPVCGAGEAEFEDLWSRVLGDHPEAFLPPRRARRPRTEGRP